jgi:hypothetical protein
MDGNELTGKYKDRAKSSEIVKILNLMIQHGITYQDLQTYEAQNVFETRRQLLKIRKRQNLKEVVDGGRSRKVI